MSTSFIVTNRSHGEGAFPADLPGLEFAKVYAFDSASTTLAALVAAGFTTCTEAAAISAARTYGNSIVRAQPTPGKGLRNETLTPINLEAAGCPMPDPAFNAKLLTALSDAAVRAAVVAAQAGTAAPATGLFS